MDLNEAIEKMRAIKCPQCGGTDIDILDLSTAECKHCGTKIIIDKPKTEVVNNITVVSDGSGELPIKYYKVKEEYGKDVFLKKTLEVLSEDLSTPIDIMDSSFSKVKQKDATVVMHKAVAHISYTAALGYEVKETYYEYDSIQKKNVQKTRYVIEYKPTNGSSSGEYGVLLPSGDKRDLSATNKLFTGKNSAHHTDRFSVIEAESSYVYSHFSSAAKEALSNAKTIDEVEALPVILSEDGKETAKEEILSGFAEQVKNSLRVRGVKEIKDFTYTGHVENFLSIDCFSVPQYSLDYSYNEKEYHAVAFPVGKSEIVYSAPSEAGDVEETIAKKNFPSSFLAMLFLITSMMISLLVHNVAICVVAAIISVATFIISVVNKKTVQKKLIDGRQEEKRARLAEYLSNKGL